MTPLIPRFLRVFYRKEPISSFILVVGAVNLVLGGVGQRWSLFSLGLVVAMIAVGLRWWQGQKSTAIASKHQPQRFLPPSSSRPPLPMLTHQRHRP